MSNYCTIAPGHPLHGPYHDGEYGFPLADEGELFERLTLEIFQAGLSWVLILRKRPAFQQAFAGFAVDRVARFGARDVARLMADEGIVRNRLKIEATVANAKTVQGLRASHGGFAGWLDAHHPLGLDAWIKLFRATFRFTGREVVNEFLMSTGYLPGAHAESCPVHARIGKLSPPWARAAVDAAPIAADPGSPPHAAPKPGPRRTASKPIRRDPPKTPRTGANPSPAGAKGGAGKGRLRPTPNGKTAPAPAKGKKAGAKPGKAAAKIGPGRAVTKASGAARAQKPLK
jgi:DNA-3-methyladenine glycosylase I